VPTLLRRLPSTVSSTRNAATGLVPRGAATWLVLVVAAVAVLCAADVLPFYDYYLWLFQGHVLGALAFGPDPGGALAAVYRLSLVPVPNLAAPGLIGLLDIWLPVEVAGLVFVVVTVVGFAVAFGLLSRTLQRRPSWVDHTGFLWAFGFFLYKGYLSYLFGLALAFVLIAVLERSVRRSGELTWATFWLLSAVGVAVYLSHLIAWSIAVLAVALYAVVLARNGRGTHALRLATTVVPAALLLAWYALAERGGTGLALYTSWSSKAISLGEPLLFVLRLDPFPPAFPVFWANVAVGLAVVALAAHQVQWSGVTAAVRTRPVLWLSGLLAAVALLVPIDEVNELIKPDERFVLPAVLLALAALPHRQRRPATTAAVAVLVVAVLGLHLVEYRAVAPRIDQLDAATDAFVGSGSRVLQLAIPSHSGCTPAFGLSVGVPTLKWFGVDHVLETDPADEPAAVELDETSIVHRRSAADAPVLTALTPDTPAQAVAMALATAGQHSDVLVVACPDDLAATGDGLAPAYAPVASGDGFVLFSRR
jgi:hypothetical protein